MDKEQRYLAALHAIINDAPEREPPCPLGECWGNEDDVYWAGVEQGAWGAAQVAKAALLDD